MVKNTVRPLSVWQESPHKPVLLWSCCLGLVLFNVLHELPRMLLKEHTQGFPTVCKPQLLTHRLFLTWWRHKQTEISCRQPGDLYHLWMKASLSGEGLCLSTELLHIPGFTLGGKSASTFLLTELLYWHGKETFSMCFPLAAQPLFLSEDTFSNLILIMALSLLWFQLLQPLRRLFFWPTIQKTPPQS